MSKDHSSVMEEYDVELPEYLLTFYDYIDVSIIHTSIMRKLRCPNKNVWERNSARLFVFDNPEIRVPDPEMKIGSQQSGSSCILTRWSGRKPAYHDHSRIRETVNCTHPALKLHGRRGWDFIVRITSNIIHNCPEVLFATVVVRLESLLGKRTFR